MLCSILTHLADKRKSWYIRGLTLRNSFLSTCSLPSTSSILNAMWNPVRGSATAMHCQTSELCLNTFRKPHTKQCTWLVGQIKHFSKQPSRQCLQIYNTNQVISCWLMVELHSNVQVCKAQTSSFSRKCIHLSHKITAQSIHHNITGGGDPVGPSSSGKVWESTY